MLGLTTLATLSLSAPPSFTLDLDLPPRQRWRGALSKVLSTHSFEDSFLPVFAEHNLTLFQRLPATAWPVLTASIEKFWPEQADELRGISDEFVAHGHQVSYEYLAGWVWFHELAHSSALHAAPGHPFFDRECTALLAHSEAGATLHVGNMDQSPPAVRNATLRVRFVRGGATLFEGVDWYWFTTGLSRVVRKGVASLQENWRTSKTPTPLATMLERIAAGPSRATPQMFIFRAVLAVPTPLPYDALVAHLTHVPLAAPFYVVIGGPRGAGAILARNESGSEGVDTLSSTAPWLVQTNYDRWMPDPSSDPRRTRAEGMLRQISAAAEEPATTTRRPHANASAAPLTAIDLFAVASAYPVHNPHTAYTAVMEPDSGSLQAYVRDALCPVEGNSADTRYCKEHYSRSATG